MLRPGCTCFDAPACTTAFNATGSGNADIALTFTGDVPITVTNSPAGWLGDGVHAAVSIAQVDTNAAEVSFTVPINTSITAPAPPNGISITASGLFVCAGEYSLID